MNQAYPTGRQRTLKWTDTIVAPLSVQTTRVDWPGDRPFGEFPVSWWVLNTATIPQNYAASVDAMATVPSGGLGPRVFAPFITGKWLSNNSQLSAQASGSFDNAGNPVYPPEPPAPSPFPNVFEIQIGVGTVGYPSAPFGVQTALVTVADWLNYSATVGGIFTITADTEEVFVWGNDAGSGDFIDFSERLRVGGQVTVSFFGLSSSYTITPADAFAIVDNYDLHGSMAAQVANGTGVFTVPLNYTDTAGSQALGVPWSQTKYHPVSQPRGVEPPDDPHLPQNQPVTANAAVTEDFHAGVSLSITEPIGPFLTPFGDGGTPVQGGPWNAPLAAGSSFLVYAPSASAVYRGICRDMDQPDPAAPIPLVLGASVGALGRRGPYLGDWGVGPQATDASGNYGPVIVATQQYDSSIDPTLPGAPPQRVFRGTPYAAAYLYRGQAVVPPAPFQTTGAFAWLHGKNFDSMTLHLPASTTLDPCNSLTNWAATSNVTLSIVGGQVQAVVAPATTGAISIAFAGPPYPQGWAYRYLQVSVASAVNTNAPFSLHYDNYSPGGEVPNPVAKEWDAVTGTAGVATNVLIDTCSPTRPDHLTVARLGELQSDYEEARNTQWNQFLASHASQTDRKYSSWMWGLGPVPVLEIYNLQGGETYTFSGMAWVRTTADVNIANFHGLGAGFDCRCDNKHYSLEVNPDDFGFSLAALATGAAVDTSWVIVQAGATDAFHDNTLPAAWLWGSGYLWDGAWESGIGHDATVGFTIQAQSLFLTAHFYPNIGNPFDGSPYPVGIYSAAFPANFHEQVGRTAAGFAFQNNGLPATGDVVDVSDGAGHLDYASATVAADGYWQLPGAGFNVEDGGLEILEETNTGIFVNDGNTIDPGIWDRICFRAPASTAAGVGPWNLETCRSFYLRVESVGGQIYVHRSNYWKPPFVMLGLLTAPTAGDTDTEPRVCYFPDDNSVHVLFTRTHSGTPSVYEAVSTDGGATWGVPTVLFSGAKHPAIVRGVRGDVIRAAYSGGTLIVTVQRSQQDAQQAQFTFGGVSPADDTFQIGQETWAPYEWMLHVNTGAATAGYTSPDFGANWSSLAGVGITGGTNPTLAIGVNGGALFSACVVGAPNYNIHSKLMKAGRAAAIDLGLLQLSGGGGPVQITQGSFNLEQSLWAAHSWLLTAIDATAIPAAPADWEGDVNLVTFTPVPEP